MTSAVARALAAAGRPVRTCPACGRHFDPSLNYAGGRLGGPRGYCSRSCRDTSAVQRSTVIRGHRSTWHDLAERHRLEDAGQLPLIDGALPAVPAPPPPPTRTPDEPLPLEATP